MTISIFRSIIGKLMKLFTNRYLIFFLSLIFILTALILLRYREKTFEVFDKNIELVKNEIELYFRDIDYKEKKEQLEKLISENKFTNARNNIILITIDTLRADHLGCYEHQEVETPNIDKLAKEGALFYNTISVADITCPSHTSILTGLYPYKHKVRDNANFYLDDRFTTLTEILKDNGYTTAAFPSAYVLHSKYGLNQGFDYYDDKYMEQKEANQDPERTFKGHKIYKYQRYADEVTLQLLKWLVSNKDKKFFTWIHYFDPHAPYIPPPKYRKDNAGEKQLYYGEINFVDECIGYIFKYINSNQADNNTLIVITADHGEAFGENNIWGHNTVIYDPLIKVPLIFYLPSKVQKAQKIENQVRIVDIMPTILDLAGIKYSLDIDGKSLMPLITNDGHYPDVPAFSENVALYIRKHEKYGDKGGEFEIFSIRTNLWKILKYINPQKNEVKTELYNISKDPGESHNIAGKSKELSQTNFLMEELDIFINHSETIDKRATKPVSGEAKKALKALGYLQ
jgi:arylsulfatase A-like enzyme